MVSSPEISVHSVVKSIIGNARNIKNASVLSPGSIPGGKVYRLTADMTGKGGDIVGLVRCFVYVPSDESLGSLVRVEWTRHAFGFWYRVDFYVNDGDSELDIAGRLREIARWIKVTATGSVNVGSMNRMFRRVKKNPVMDRVNRFSAI